MADIPDLDIDVIEGPGHAGNRAALDAWATAVRDGINSPKLATASAPGAMPAADKTKLDSLATGGWLDTAAKAMAAAAPGVTRVVPIDVRSLRLTNMANPSAYVAGGTPGGGAVIQAATWVSLTPDVVVANPTLVPWAFRVRANLPVPVNGRYFWMGFGVDALNLYGVAEYYAAGDRATKLALFQNLANSNDFTFGATGFVLDAAFHDIMVAYDLSLLKMYVDDVLIASVALSGKGPTAACGIGAFATSHYRPITDLAYAI